MVNTKTPQLELSKNNIYTRHCHYGKRHQAQRCYWSDTQWHTRK